MQYVAQAEAAGEARRLERLWSSSFGEAYTERNAAPVYVPGARHRELCVELGVGSILEVGCNLGLNLSEVVRGPKIATYGVDISEHALRRGRARLAGAHFVRGTVYRLPFADDSVDLVFTCGVLIHVPPTELGRALHEIRRVSRRYVWLGEYFSAAPMEIPYRGESGALFKCDFGGEFARIAGDVRLCSRGFWGRAATGYDDLTWWLFEKR